MLLWLLLLLTGLATDKAAAAAAKPSACCGAYEESRPFCFSKEQRKPTQTPSPIS
jgi:hypothetical protein